MKYTLQQNANPATLKSDCLVVPLFNDKDSDKAVMHEAAMNLNAASNGQLDAFLNKGDFTAKLDQAEILYDLDQVKSTRVMLVGCGERDKFNLECLNQVIKTAAGVLKTLKLEKVALFLADPFEENSIVDAAMQTVLAHADSQYQLTQYKSEKTPPSVLKEVSVALCTSYQANLKTAVRQAQSISHGVALARDLANQPGNVCNPSYLAKQAKKLARKYDPINVKVLEEKDMEKLGMGAFLSVSKGSDHPGKLIVLQYKGAADKKQPPVALVGKGITFDTGGISLKPGANMDEMKFDMAGAAGMLGTLMACAEMALPINLVVVLAAAENMPSGHASRPGDIVTSMAGKTIEILNTDAEGRLVLCDALTYVSKFKPAVVIDAATLTGACIIALGHQICAVLSNDDDLADELIKSGNSINDRTWQLPMGESYTKQLKSAFADLGNIGGRAAGTITAACFLGEFCKDYKWAHLDIAGTAWNEKDATGRPVPLLSRYLIERASA